MIEALLFDAAGTLIEPVEPVASVYARVAGSFGQHLAPSAIKSAFGRAFERAGDPDWDAHPHGDAAERAWWRGVVDRTFRDALAGPWTGDRFDECFESLFSHYASTSAWRVFPEVRAVLTAAKECGFRLGVVSNFDLRLHGILEGLKLDFEVVITSADARSRKPDPAIFIRALDQLGLSSGQVLHAGDSKVADGEGAAAAGIVPILIERPRDDLRVFFAEALGRRGK